MSDFEFKHIDDYDFLFGPDEKTRRLNLRIGNRFKALINQHFDETLIFGLVEMVNLNHPELGGEGEVFIFSNFDKKKNQELKKEYENIIEQVKTEYVAIAKFKDWYKFNSFVLLKSNENPIITSSAKAEWKLDGELQSEKREPKEYGHEIGEDFDEEYIKKYLKYYAELIHNSFGDNNEFGFSKFPHYAIIVRPIAVPQGNEVHKLGNLYLHFATTESKDYNFYTRFINDFIIVWINEKGSLIIEKLQEEAQSEILQVLKPYYPNLQHTDSPKRLYKKISGREFSFADLYDQIFENYSDSYHTDLIKVKDSLLPNLLKYRNLHTGNSLEDCEEIIKTYTRIQLASPKIVSLKDADTIEHFKKVLIRRQIFNCCYFLGNLSLNKIKDILMNCGFNTPEPVNSSYAPGATHKLNDSLYQYFWTNMLLPITKESVTAPKANIQKKVYNSLSKVEKDFLVECYKFCVDLIPTNKMEEFDSFVYTKITSNLTC